MNAGGGGENSLGWKRSKQPVLASYFLLMLLTDSSPPLPDGPRFFGRRGFRWLAGGFLIGFALMLAAIWLQSRQDLSTLETAVPIVQLNAAPSDAEEPPE